MPIWTGNWTAKVDQDFEIEADTREEFEDLLREEMSPRNVVELFDMEPHNIEKDDLDVEG